MGDHTTRGLPSKAIAGTTRGGTAVPVRPGGPRPAPGAVRHGHLWVLPDGTGLHAPPGQVVRDEAGRACCHLCGRWYRALGHHVRVHGHTAASYRLAMGLCTTKALITAELSEKISSRQAVAYRRSPDLRDRLRQGQDMARSGQLSWRARAARYGEVTPAQRTSLRRAALAAGRTTTATHRDVLLTARLAELGATSLHGYLREAYAQGASLARLSRDTGLGHVRLRAAMADADITIRPRGHQPAVARRSRARTAERAAAARIGTDDVVRWIADRHAQGWTLSRLAAAVGHTTHWVRWRLDRTRP